MKKKILLIGSFIIAFVFQVSAQCSMYPVLLSQRVPQSSLIIEGKVVNKQSFWNNGHDKIYTSNLVEVYKTFKNASAAYIEVITEGGTVGGDREVVEPSLELNIGDIGVFTLNSISLPSQFGKLVYEPFASAQGFIKYDIALNEANEPFKKYSNISSNLYPEIQLLTSTNYTIIKPVNLFSSNTLNITQAIAAITSFTPTSITAGTSSTLTINGSGFGTTTGTVSFKNADDGGATFINAAPSQILSWTASQIKVLVPTRTNISGTAGTGVIQVNGVSSVSSLTVNYGHLNVDNSGNIFNTQHYGQTSGGYIWTYNSAFITNTAAKAAFERSLATWRCNTYINWQLAATTSTIVSAANDGVNIVTFQTGLPAGVLGRCSSYWSGCGSGTTMKWYVTELDIVFAPTPGSLAWQYGPTAPTTSQYDFESVTVHELGHGHQLSHVINSLDLMHYSLTNGQSKRNLNTDDLNGGLAVMARNTSSVVCAKALMTPLNSGNCNIGAPTANFTADKTSICPGQSVIFTNLSTGSPTATIWTFAGGTPSTSTVSSPTVTYNTPGSYSVQLVATNANGSSTYSVVAYINVVNPAGLPLVQDFQSATFPPTNWYINDAGNDNITWKLTTIAGYNSTQSTLFDNWTDSITPNRDELKTYVNLGSFASAKMTFYRAYSQTFTSPYIDTLQIGISTNCGTSTTYPYLKGGSQLATATTSSSAAPFTPTASTQWKKDSIDLTPYVGQANVMISFINRGHYGDAIYLDNINITGVAATSPTAAITSASVGCTGVPITLTDASTGGPTSWTWSMAGGTPSVATTQNASVTYSTAGVKTITLTVTNGTGTTTATKSITITATPTVVASVTNTTICNGGSIIENLIGATTYTWLPSGSGATSTLSPTSTTIYTITGSTNGCTSAAQNVTVIVTQNPTVNITASSATICAGQSSTLTASGATTYAWLPGGQTTAGIVVTPTANTTYTVTGSNGTCSSSKTISVNVSSTPTVVASITNTTICSGTSIVASVTGATSYTWLPFGSGSTSTLSPTSTTIYTVTGSNGSCVSASKNFTINVTSSPTLAVTASSSSICAGQSSTLTANGATTYAWLPGGQTTAGIVVTPTTNTTYTVTGSNGTCSSSKTISVNVSTTPTVATSITNTTICSGTSIVASVTGAASYTWLPSGSGSTSTLSPTSTTIYTVTGSNGSCVSTSKNFTINVTSSPTLAITASSSSICAGQSSTLTATGATNYSWLPGGQTTTIVVVTPSVTSTYTLNGSNGTCYGTKTITINVVNTPTLVTSITNTTICSGTTVLVNVTGGASSYTWLPNGSGTTSNLTPTTTTIYTVTGSSGNCVSVPVTFTINVNTTPTVNIGVTSSSICVGQSTTLTASGAITYSWLPGGQTNASIVITPTASTIYTVSGSNGICSSSKTVSINVSTTPTVIASITNTTICSGTSVVVGLSGASSYTWLPSGSGSTSTLSPMSTTIYTVTGSNGSCIGSSNTFTVNVNSSPTLTSTASPTLICTGQNSTLTVIGATNYTWTPSTTLSSANGNVVVANPTITTIYTVTGSNGTCNSNNSIVLTVSACTGIENLTTLETISIYPNPNNGVFTVYSSVFIESLNITILNTLGQIVKTENIKNSNQATIDISMMSKGIYYLKVYTNEGSKLFKLILE